MTTPSATDVALRVVPRPTTIMIAIAAITLICALGAWVALDGGRPFSVDSAWHAFVGAAPDTAGYAIAVTLATIGSAVGVSACVGIAAVWLFMTGNRLDAIALVATAALGVACSELLKLLVARPRPVDALLEPPGFSYPSGHAMGAAVLATALALTVLARSRSKRLRPWSTVAAMLWVAAMMWSRTALHVHWLSDTVAGALLGWSVAVLVRASVCAIAARTRGESSSGLRER